MYITYVFTYFHTQKSSLLSRELILGVDFMIDTENFFNLGTDYFSFVGQKCQFEIQKNDNPHIDSKNILSISSDGSEKLYFSFSGNEGLCLTTEFGSIIQKNILGKFLSLRSNNAKELLNFFDTYGYFFKMSSNESNVVDFNNLIQLTYHIKAALLLMNALQQKSMDYDDILNLTLFLLLSPKVEMKITDKQTYTGYHESALDVIDSVIAVTDNSNYITIDGEDYYNIADLVYGTHYNLRVDEYEDISTGEHSMYSYPGIDDLRYKKITIAYKNSHNVPKIQRLVIDFLFHFMNTNGVVKNVAFDSGIEFYGNSNLNLDEQMKKTLLLIAKYVLAQEINHHVSRMKPIYNPITLEPSWRAPNLLTALYFSLFYMKPKSEIYRKCANPSCTNFFLVKTSNSRKKYCCDACRNASNQRDYRFRQKK